MQIEINFPLESAYAVDKERRKELMEQRRQVQLRLYKHFPNAHSGASRIGQYAYAHSIVIPNPDTSKTYESISTGVPPEDILNVLDILETVDSKFVYLLSYVLQPYPVA